ANLPALAARIAADKAKYADPPDPRAAALAEGARKTERQFHLLKAEESLLRGQFQLAEALDISKPVDEEGEKAREKKIAAARKQLQDAQDGLSKSVESYSSVGQVYPKSSSGRRLALAQWITSRQNPLTARVAVNHMWLRHFGKALVPTIS